MKPTMHELRNQHVFIGQSRVRSKKLLCFVQGQGQKRNKNIQQRTLSSFITIPSINYGTDDHTSNESCGVVLSSVTVRYVE